jgi:tetratricopeptide (TPR) repeat protein
MTPDHIATLRTAEKLLRVGKIAAAIAEYTKAVTQAPQDWDTAILLASLHARNNDVNAAVTQYRDIATRLTGERMHARAAQVLEKVLALRPGDEDTLEQLAGASAANGDIAAACSHLMRIAERRISRGELPRAIDALEKAATLDPAGSGAAARLFDLCLQSGDLSRARKYAAGARDCRTLATALRKAGQASDARDLLRNAYRLDPSDLSSAATLAADYLREGDIEHAAEFLSPAVIGNDPATRAATIDLFLHAGRGDAAMQMAASLAAESSDGIDRIAELACSLANEAPDTAYALAELALAPWIDGHAWDSAIAALELFTTAVPDFPAALIRLVEVAVDAERLDIADRAQEMLAGAYLTRGDVAEALHIAQDLHERDPRNSRYDALLQRARQATRQGSAHDDVIVPMRAAR